MKTEISERLWWANDESRKILGKGYLNEGETINDAIRRAVVASLTRGNKLEDVEETIEMIERGWMSLSTPIWANMGTERGLPISCFNTHVGDSIESISDKLTEVIMETKSGGGTSGYFGDIRERGAEITGNGKSSGAVSFMELFNSAMNVVSQGSCYQEGTKVLTQRGYVDFREVQESDLLAQVDEYNNVSFTNDYELVVNPFKGQLVKIKGKKRDDLVNIGITPNHRMVIERRKGTRKKGKYWAGNTEIVKAEDLKLHRDNRMFFSGNTEVKGRGLTAEEQFMIAFQADGRKDNRTKTAIFRFKKDRKIERLIDIIEELGVKYEIKVDKNEVTNIYVYEVEHLKEEFLTWIDLSKISLQWCNEFIEEISHWDGSKNKNRSSIDYSTIYEQNINIIQSIASICGKRTRVLKYENRDGDRQDLFNITISDVNKIQGDSCEIYNEEYDGNVYCAVVPKGRLIVNYEGRTLVCGNTRRGAFAAYLPVDHPDIEEFLTIKSIGSSIQNLFYGVCIPDYWLKEMEEGDREKRTIWAKILESRQEKGLPYLFFTDNANNNKPQIYKDRDLKINASNLCIVGSDRVVTDRGYLTAKELHEQGGELILFDGDKPVKSSEMKLREENAEVFKVTLENGMTHTVTNYHGMAKMDERGNITRTELKDLKVGDYIGIQTKKGLFGGKEMLDEAPKFEKTNIQNWLWESNETTQWEYIKSFLYDCCEVFNSNSEDGQIQISYTDINHSLLKDLQILLNNLGISSSIKLLNEGLYQLIIINENDVMLIEEKTKFLSGKNIVLEDREYRDNSKKRQKVVSIEFVGYEDVYCPTVYTDEHIFVANGFLTFNCSEIMLPSTLLESFVCCLSSMNLELYDEWKDTRAVELAINFLDGVMSEFIEKTEGMYGMEYPRNFAMRHRALGLGVMGWHSYLQKNNISFESLEAKVLTGKIFKGIQKQAIEASEKLGEHLGHAPIFYEGETTDKPRRNTTVMAIAPTTSSSAILGQASPGIEPFSSNYYKVGLSKGNFMRKNKYLAKLLEEKGLDNDDIWRSIMLNSGSVQHLDELTRDEKDVFKTFKEISQYEIILQASIRQQYVDQGQSLNLNIPADLPVKEVNQLMLLAWKKGLKSLYYQRSQSVSKEMVVNMVKCTSCEG